MKFGKMKNTITAIEWAENISDIIPKKYYKISILQTGEEKKRDYN